MITGPKRKLRARIDELRTALEELEDGVETEQEDDLIDRSGYQKSSYFTVGDYTDSFYANLKDITQSLDDNRHYALDDPHMHYKDAFERLCLSTDNVFRMMYASEMYLPLDEDDKINIFMITEQILRRHKAATFGGVDMDDYKDFAYIFPHVAHLPLKYPENIHPNNIIATLYDDKDYYTQVLKNTQDQQAGAENTYMSANQNHLFYLNPQYEKDIRYCGCITKRIEKNDKLKTETIQPYYYLPDWHGTEKEVTFDFVSESMLQKPVRIPNGPLTKYIKTPEYAEKHEWVFGMYQTARTMLGCDPAQEDLYECTKPSKARQYLYDLKLRPKV